MLFGCVPSRTGASRLFFASSDKAAAVVLHPELHRPVPLEPLQTTLERITTASAPGSATATEQPLKNQPTTQMI